MPAVAQAEVVTDRGVAPLVALGFGPHLEGRGGTPLVHVGQRTTVEVGITIAGGSIFVFELGLRASHTAPREQFYGVYTRQVAGLFGGARIYLDRERWFGALRPLMRGGISVQTISQTYRPPRAGLNAPSEIVGDVTAGPYLGVGLEWSLGSGAALSVEVMSHVAIVPLVLDFAGQLTFVAARF